MLPGDGQPLLIANPTNLIGARGQAVTFSAEALAYGRLVRYQWRRYGTNLPGETNASLVIPSAQPTHAGAYSVLAMTDSGAASSPTAWFSVTNPPPELPSGSVVRFRGGTSGGPSGVEVEIWAGPSPFQLEKIGANVPMVNGLFDGGNRRVATLTANQVYCRFVFRDPSFPGASLLSSLRAYPLPKATPFDYFAPGYVEWPDPVMDSFFVSPVVIPTSSDFSLQIGAYSTYPSTYQWYKDGVPIGPAVAMPGPAFPGGYVSENAPLVLTNVQASDAASYFLVGSNATNISVSLPKQITVLATNLVLAPPMVSNGVLAFQIFTGPLRTQIVIQVSPDLAIWTPLTTLTVTGRVANFVQPLSTLTNLFFRAVANP